MWLPVWLTLLPCVASGPAAATADGTPAAGGVADGRFGECLACGATFGALATLFKRSKRFCVRNGKHMGMHES